MDHGYYFLTFHQFAEINRERAAVWHNNTPWTTDQWATAVTGEWGEACNVLKKLNRASDGIVGNSKTVAELEHQLAEEIADTVTYLFLFADACGVNIAGSAIRKFNKVSEKHGFPQRL